MARNQIIGKVIAISDKQSFTGKESGKTTEKRQLFLDCTRFDPYTGERGFENTPLLEFTNKALEKLEVLMGQGLKKDDVVTVSFDIQGNKWKNAEGKTQIITSIRPYDIEITRPQTNTTETTQQASAPVDNPPQQTSNDLPF